MQDPSGDELLTKLAYLVHQYERNIKTGESKLCLTSNSIIFLNKCFEQFHSDPARHSTERLYQKSTQSCVNYLEVLTKELPSLKIVPGPSPRLDILLNISQFKNLQYLEIKKTPLGYIKGLQSLRQQLKGLTCFRSVFALSEVFICCGGDLSSTPFAWERLQEANLSYNSINNIDDSLKLLPVLEVLNLSHNNIISPDDDKCWQFLCEVKYVNLGYNQLNKVPCSSSFTISPSLRTLILRNNDIQNLRGIEQFTSLEHLDVSNNCIISFHELVPLAHLERLTSLQLTGNPVCYCDDYRIRSVSYMSPYPRKGDVFLDNEVLSPFERTFVGGSVNPVSPLTYLSTNVTSDEVYLESSEDMTDGQPLVASGSKKKKSKKVKARNVSIVSDVEDEETLETSMPSSQGMQSLEHSQDIERLEKARDLGGEHWLPAINHVLHGDTSINQEPAIREERLDSLTSASPYSVHHELISVDVNPSPIKRRSSTSSQHSDYVILVRGQPFIVNLKNTTGDHDEHDDNDQDLLVTVTEHFIRERAAENSEVIFKLEIDSLMSAKIEESQDGEFCVHLKFDYLNRDRKERYYIMEDKKTCEQFLEVLHPVMKSNEEAKNIIAMEHLQCLKCSAYFTEEVSECSDHICPDCGSTQIIEVQSPDIPINTRTDQHNDNGPKLNGDKSPLDNQAELNWLSHSDNTMPDLIPGASPKAAQMNQPDIYNTNAEKHSQKQTENELKVFNVVKENLENSYNSQSNDNTESPSIEPEDENSYVLNSSSDFTINVSTNFIVNEELLAKDSPPLRTSVLSNSMKSSEHLNNSVENRQESPKSKMVTPQKRVIDIPISLKTSSQNAATDIGNGSFPSTGKQSNSMTTISENQTSNLISTPNGKIEVEKQSIPQRKTSSNQQSMASNESIPQRKTSASQQNMASSPSSNVIKNLFSMLGSKLSGSTITDEQDSSKSRTPKIESKLIYEISPDEFKDCDHRLKLYFEVSVFTGGQDEVLNCLIKAPVIVYGEKAVSSALLVVSNMALYILKLEETAGLSANECLSLIGSYHLKDIQFVDLGLNHHSFRVELNGESPASFTVLVRDTERCKRFCHLLLKHVNQFKSCNGLPHITETDRNLQTLANIRSQVLGIRQEELVAMGERYEEQLTLFTDPPLIRNRKSLLRHYSQCFIGKDFVDWLIHNGEANTRTEGVDIAQRLVTAGFIEHVSKECKFEDKEQFYKFCLDSDLESTSNGKDKDDQISSFQDDLNDTDTHITVAIMAFKVLEPANNSMTLKPVTVIVTRTHLAVAEENHQWPLPRYLDVPTPTKQQFHCIEKYKMTDITGMEFFEDSPCHIGISISEEDAPLECADSYLLIKTETTASIEALAGSIRTPWEEQFGVELQTTTLPFLDK